MALICVVLSTFNSGWRVVSGVLAARLTGYFGNRKNVNSQQSWVGLTAGSRGDEMSTIGR
jgi:hypothetical protein